MSVLSCSAERKIVEEAGWALSRLCCAGGEGRSSFSPLRSQENDNLLDSRSYRVTDKSVNSYFARYQFISFSLNYYKVIAMGMKYIIVYIT